MMVELEDPKPMDLLSKRAMLSHWDAKVFNVYKKKTKYIRKTDYCKKEIYSQKLETKKQSFAPAQESSIE